MNIDNLLREELLRRKKRIQDESRAKEKPEVFSDVDLEKIVKVKPQSKEELNKLVKIDYRYVDEIVDVVTSLVANSSNFCDLNPDVLNTIRELEKKLVEINKRNRMLYIPKLPQASFDLNTSGNDPFDLLFRHKTFKISINSVVAFKLFNAVYRDTEKNYRDKGILDLYVGYPFIKGKIADDFYIHAPLALFPISIEKGIDFIKLKLDTSREVTYNSHLLLANYKFKEINKTLPNVVIEDLNLANFMTNLIDFYNEEGIRFYRVSKDLAPFIQVKADDLKYYRIGDYSVESYAVLARFSSYSTILQKDFEQILQNKIITKNLAKLLSNNTADFGSTKEFFGDLDYVGELNSSQEEVIKNINVKDAVVVEGPPGTGKSQTITSLVTNFVLNDKSVLLVSEKKAALDVVYSRLGILNKFALQIDDINDKDGFYKSLIKIFSDEDVKTLNSNQEELIEIDKKINNITTRFQNIADIFYKDSNFGTSCSQMYQETTSFNLDNPGDKITYNVYTNRETPIRKYISNGLVGYQPYDCYLKLSDYNQLLKMRGLKEIALKDDEYFIHTFRDVEKELKNYLHDHQNIQIGEYTLRNKGMTSRNYTTAWSRGSSYIVIVPDQVITDNFEVINQITMIDTKEETTEQFSERMHEKFPPKVYVEDGDTYQTLISIQQVTIRGEVLSENRSMATILTFSLMYLAFIFIAVVGTILSIQSLSDSTKYRYRYITLHKLGMSEHQINKTLAKQLFIFFITPIIYPLLISISTAYSLSFVFDAFMKSDYTIFSYVLFNIFLFLFIYIIYYLATYFGFKKNIREEIKE